MTARYAVLIVVSAVVLFPVWAAIMVATKPLRDLGSLDVLVPGSVDTGGFPDAFHQGRLGR